MRSGTHAAIVLVLNNFPAYQRKPLYLNFDEYAMAGLPFQAIRDGGGYVIKTHYPQMTLPETGMRALKELAERSEKQPLPALKDSA